MKHLKSIFAHTPRPVPSVPATLLTNFASCPLGLALARRLSLTPCKLILVSPERAPEFEHKPNVVMFAARLQDETDRNRLIAYLKQEDVKLN